MEADAIVDEVMAEYQPETEAKPDSHSQEPENKEPESDKGEEEKKSDEDEAPPIEESEEVRNARKERNRAIRQQKRTEANLGEVTRQLEELKRQSRPDDENIPAEDGDIQARIDGAVASALAKARAEESFSNARERFKDFDQVMAESKDIDIGDHLFDAVQNSKASGLVIYHLMDNPDEFDRINDLGPQAARKEVERIERLMVKGGQKVETKPEPKAISNAPKPAEPVGGSRKAEPQIGTPEWFEHRNRTVKPY